MVLPQMLSIFLAVCFCSLSSTTANALLSARNVEGRHGPQNRRAWRDGFDIYSDYTNNSIIPPGKVVEYEFVVSQQIIAPDGYEKLGMVVNGKDAHCCD
jgi:hypothetical protein